MEEYRIGKAIVRVHGSPDPEKLKAATAQFLKEVLRAQHAAEKAKREEKSA